jgi:hypothetical protein
MRYIVRILKLALGVFVAAVALGSVIETTHTIPDTALIFMDPVEGRYYGPTCLPLDEADQRELSRLLASAKTPDDASAAILAITGLMPGLVGSARSMRFEPDRACQENGAFVAEGRSLARNYLEQRGILPPSTPRWNADGSWNW